MVPATPATRPGGVASGRRNSRTAAATMADLARVRGRESGVTGAAPTPDAAPARARRPPRALDLGRERVEGRARIGAGRDRVDDLLDGLVGLARGPGGAVGGEDEVRPEDATLEVQARRRRGRLVAL